MKATLEETDQFTGQKWFTLTNVDENLADDGMVSRIEESQTIGLAKDGKIYDCYCLPLDPRDEKAVREAIK